MSYNKLFSLIEEDSRMTSFISNISSGYMDIPNIMVETLKLLEDESPFVNLISDSNKKSLCIMMDQYFTDCWSLYIDDMKLDKLLQYGKIEKYKVDAADGLRDATEYEVAQGVMGLIPEYIYPAGEDEYKKLCLLEWSFYGKSYFYRQAGHKLDYDDKGKVTNTFYELIFNCAYELKALFEWVSVKENVDKAIAKIKKFQRSKGFKYATYAKDEIKEDITIKQLVMNVYKIFPRNSSNVEYRRALALALKAYKNNQKLTPLEVSSLREIYEKHALDIANNKTTANETDDELKDKCNFLLAERFKGAIDQNHFAYTIISTIKRNNYTKCSPKQYKIINEAYNIVNKTSGKNDDKENEKTQTTMVISDDEIDSSMSLYNIGSDELFDEEDA
jgi:hypothetical protein